MSRAKPASALASEGNTGVAVTRPALKARKISMITMAPENRAR